MRDLSEVKKTCLHKRKYGTKATALAKALCFSIQKRRRKDERKNLNLKPYRCSYCQLWHLTTVYKRVIK